VPVAIDEDQVGRTVVVARDPRSASASESAAAPSTTYRRPRRRTRSALDVLIVGTIAYGGALLLNASHLHRQATRLPLDSPARPVALAATGSVRWMSRLVGLDQPGAYVDRVRSVGGDVSPIGRTPSHRPIGSLGRADVDETPAGSSPASAPTSGPVPSAVDANASADRIEHANAIRRQLLDKATITGDAATRAAERAAADAAASSTTAPSATRSAPAAPATPTTIPRLVLRAPTVQDPWRVYVGGDSLAQGVGPALERVGTDSKLMQVQPRGVLASGLSRPDTFNWPAEITNAERGSNEIVVLVFGANDPQTMATPSGNVEFGTPEWETEYRRRVDEVLDTLAGKTVVWLGLPVVGRPELERQLVVLDRIYREATANRKNVSFIDVRALTSSDGVSYEPYLDGGNGEQFLARTNDKVHFTVRGYDTLANAVVTRLLELTH
jgi:hypothetical protein